MHTHTCAHTQACCVEQQGSSVQSVLSSSPWVLGIRCRLSGLFSKHLYPLSYLARAKVILHASFPPCGPEFQHVKNKSCIFLRLRLRKYTSISNIAAKRYCWNEWKLECTRTPRGKDSLLLLLSSILAVFHILTSFYLNTFFVLEEAYYSPRWFLELIKLGQFSFESTAETWYDKILSCE